MLRTLLLATCLSSALFGCGDSEVEKEVVAMKSTFTDIEERFSAPQQVVLDQGIPLPDQYVANRNEPIMVAHGDIIDASDFYCPSDSHFKAIRFEESQGTQLETKDSNYVHVSYTRQSHDEFKVFQSEKYVGDDAKKAMLMSDRISRRQVLATLMCVRDYFAESGIIVSLDEEGEVKVTSSIPAVQAEIDALKNTQ